MFNRLPGWFDPEKFFHTHVHSIYSMRDGLLSVDDLVNTSKKRGQSVVALTDHGSLSGIWQLYEKANESDMIPCFGCELYVSPSRDSLMEWRDHLATHFDIDDSSAPRDAIRNSLARNHHLIVLAKNRKGWENLLAIHNESWKNGFYRSPRTTREFLAAHSEGLVASTACYSGEVPQYIVSGNRGTARRCVEEYKEIFGKDNFYIELQLMDFKPGLKILPDLVELAIQTKTKMTVTCDAHYLKKEHHELHFWVLNVSTIKEGLKGKDLKDKKSRLWELDAKDLYLKSVNDFWDFWVRNVSDKIPVKYLQQAVEGVDNIRQSIKRFYLEHEPRLPVIENSSNVIQELCVKGMQSKLKDKIIPQDKLSVYMDRLSFELEIINKMRAVDYMLIFAEVGRYCVDNDLTMGPGRGSAAGSLVSWLLGITGLDPISHGLLFERFLNVDRLPSMRLDLKP